MIEVDAAGQVRFYEIGAKGPINDSKDSYGSAATTGSSA